MLFKSIFSFDKSTQFKEAGNGMSQSCFWYDNTVEICSSTFLEQS
jgi:hypothetical protein